MPSAPHLGIFLLASAALTGCSTSGPVIDPTLPPISAHTMTITGRLDPRWQPAANTYLDVGGDPFAGFGADAGTVDLQPDGRFTAALDEPTLEAVAAQPDFGSLCPPQGTYDVHRTEINHLSGVRTTWIAFVFHTTGDLSSYQNLNIRLSPKDESHSQTLVYAYGEGRIQLEESCRATDSYATDMHYTVDLTFKPGWNLVDLQLYRTGNVSVVRYTNLPLPGEIYLK